MVSPHKKPKEAKQNPEILENRVDAAEKNMEELFVNVSNLIL